jgi:hypothetical protein
VNNKARVITAGKRRGQGLMTDSGDSGACGGGTDAREMAKRIGGQIVPLIKLARSTKFDFLAYLLAMALKESRRLSGH